MQEGILPLLSKEAAAFLDGLDPETEHQAPVAFNPSELQAISHGVSWQHTLKMDIFHNNRDLPVKDKKLWNLIKSILRTTIVTSNWLLDLDASKSRKMRAAKVSYPAEICLQSRKFKRCV